MSLEPRRLLSVALAVLFGCGLFGARAEAQHYTQKNLVADQSDPSEPTRITDPNLVNPWGLSRSSGSPWWSANNGTGTSTLYNVSTGLAVAQSLVVTVPPASGTDPGVPTGTVFNGTTGFEVAPGKPARFLFATEDGTISGWNSTVPTAGSTQAVIKVTSPGAVYKGLAIASWDGSWFLYATNFAKGRVEVFDSSFHRVNLPAGDHHGDDHDGDRHEGEHRDDRRFEDGRIPRGFSPFNVQNIGGDLYVTFAKRDPANDDDVKGAGFGYVDVFSPNGKLLRRLEHGPWLNAPWGLSQAPGDFGAFSHSLLVGQFGSGEIAAYDVATGRFLGKMKVQDSPTTDHVLVIEGLWALGFGNGGGAGPLNTLFFTAGIDDEAHGLFGALTAVSAEQLLGNGL
jgi:uncharacterized protein (TIGR03118 family)